MPRFHLNIRDGDEFLEDHEGSLFADLEEARNEALASAREILSQLLRSGKRLNGQCFEITDEAGTLQATVYFKNAINMS